MKIAVMVFGAAILFAAGGHQRPGHPAGAVSVEDSVRFQTGGKLYRLNIRPSDSITVTRSFHLRREGEETYRMYRFIVHNRHSRAHYHFETPTLDSIYAAWLADEDNRRFYESCYERFASVQTDRIDPVIGDYCGYWIFLTEYGGDYYLNDSWVFRASFLIADSMVTFHNMDGLYPVKIVKAAALPDDGGISILYDGGEESIMELIDKEKQVYRLDGHSFVAPARAIHNFEIIQHTNNTGDLIPS